MGDYDLLLDSLRAQRGMSGARAVGAPVRTTTPYDDDERTNLEAVMDWIGRPGSAVAGLAEGVVRDDDPLGRAWSALKGESRPRFVDVLEAADVEPGLGRSAVGLGLDIAADPLTWLPFGAAGAAARTLKLPEAYKAAVQLPGVRNVRGGLRQAFQQHPELDPILNPEVVSQIQKARLRKSEVGHLEARVGSQVEDIYAPLAGDKPALGEIGRVIERGGGTPVQQDVARRAREHTRDFGLRQEAASVMEPGTVAAMERTGLGYTPHLSTRIKLQDGRTIKLGAARGPLTAEGTPTAQVVRTAASGSARGPLQPSDPHLKRRFTETIEEARAAGAQPDAPLAHFQKAVDAERSIIDAGYIKDVTKNPAWARPANVEAPEDWIRIGHDFAGDVQHLKYNPDFAREFADKAAQQGAIEKLLGRSPLLRKELEGTALRPDIVQHLSKLDEPVIKIPKWMSKYPEAMNYWRAAATVARPGFHVTNFLGNIYNSVARGMHPADVPKRLAEGFNWTKLTGKLGKYQADEVKTFIRRHGMDDPKHAFGKEFAEQQAEKHVLDKLGIELEKQPNFIVKYLRWAAEKGGQVENLSRRAFFLDQVKKGETLENALTNTWGALFNYAEMTPVEQGIRQAIPFYRWMRGNIPLQAQSLVQRPGLPAAVGKIQEASERRAAEEGMQVPMAGRPDYYREGGFTLLPPSIAGLVTDPSRPTFTNPYLPTTDINYLPVTGNILETGKEMLEGLGPAFKVPMELFPNRQLFSDRPIFDPALPLGGHQRPVLPLPADADVIPGIRTTAEGEAHIPRLADWAFRTTVPVTPTVGKAVGAALDPEETLPLSLLHLTQLMRVYPREKDAIAAALRRAAQDHRGDQRREGRSEARYR